MTLWKYADDGIIINKITHECYATDDTNLMEAMGLIDRDQNDAYLAFKVDNPRKITLEDLLSIGDEVRLDVLSPNPEYRAVHRNIMNGSISYRYTYDEAQVYTKTKGHIWAPKRSSLMGQAIYPLSKVITMGERNHQTKKGNPIVVYYDKQTIYHICRQEDIHMELHHRMIALGIKTMDLGDGHLKEGGL